MKTMKLYKSIGVGTLMASVAAASLLVSSHSAAASPSLYEEYQNQQKATSQVVETRDNPIVAANKAAAKAAVETNLALKDSPTEFTKRIQAILNADYSGASAYSRFLPKKTAAVEEPAPAASETAPAEHAETTTAEKPAAVPVPPVPAAGSEEIVSESSHVPASANPPVADGLYDFVWKGTPLSQSLYVLGSVAQKGIVVNGDLTGTVYANLRQVSCNTALDYLSRAYGFNWMVDGNNIIISTGKEMLQSEVFDVGYANKDKIKEEFVSLGIDAVHVYANSETSTVSVTGTPYQLQQARARLKLLDHPVAQCLLVAQLVEISHGHSLNLGMQYTLPSYTHTGSEDSASNSFNGNFLEKLTFAASAEASKALSDGKVISRPIVLAKNGDKAHVMFGDKVPTFSSTSTTTSTDVTVKYQDVGTTLEITPVINEHTGDISLTIAAEVSNITSYVTQGNTKAPQISTRNVNTSAHIKSGQSLVIGGLMSVNELDNLSGIPGLMNLPILGKLFSYHEKSKTYAEVYIMITPYIMADDINPRELIKKVQD